jgi:hypothetical protein
MSTHTLAGALKHGLSVHIVDGNARLRVFVCVCACVCVCVREREREREGERERERERKRGEDQWIRRCTSGAWLTQPKHRMWSPAE